MLLQSVTTVGLTKHGSAVAVPLYIPTNYKYGTVMKVDILPVTHTLLSFWFVIATTDGPQTAANDRPQVCNDMLGSAPQASCGINHSHAQLGQ